MYLWSTAQMQGLWHTGHPVWKAACICCPAALSHRPARRILANVAKGLWESCSKASPCIKQPLIWPWLGGSDKDNAEIRHSKFLCSVWIFYMLVKLFSKGWGAVASCNLTQWDQSNMKSNRLYLFSIWASKQMFYWFKHFSSFMGTIFTMVY